MSIVADFEVVLVPVALGVGVALVVSIFLAVDGNWLDFEGKTELSLMGLSIVRLDSLMSTLSCVCAVVGVDIIAHASFRAGWR